MNKNGFDKLFWGFFFILLNFRIQGFDILPDIIGYIFLAFGIKNLGSNTFFEQAAKYNVVMILLSVLSIYQPPAQGGGIHLGLLGVIGIPIVIASFVINLMLIYNIFMGINVMSGELGQYDLMEEADRRWSQYRNIQIALVFSFLLMFIPPLAIIYIVVLFIASIVLAINILGFIRRCSERLGLLI